MNENKLIVLKEKGIITDLHLYEEVGSTNDMAREFAKNCIANDSAASVNELFISELQSSGKGRLGRNWTSPSGTGIWMSLASRLNLEGEKMPGVTLLAAMSVARAIKGIALQIGIHNLDIKIKWPNDIVVNRKKVCGILTELVTDPKGGGYVICGIGINVNTTYFPNEIRDKATSLTVESGTEWDRESIVASTISELTEFIRRYEKEQNLGFIISEYNDMLVSLGQEVVLVENGERGEDSFISRGIDETGALLVEDSEGDIKRVISGEVSVRGILGYV